MRSPRSRRKGPWQKEEDSKPETKVFRTNDGQKKKYPVRKCFVCCFSEKRSRRQEESGPKKILCIQCLKEKKIHEKGNRECRGPPCKTCEAKHHHLLCEEVEEKKQLLKTQDDGDSDNQEKDLDNQHIRYLNGCTDDF